MESKSLLIGESIDPKIVADIRATLNLDESILTITVAQRNCHLKRIFVPATASFWAESCLQVERSRAAPSVGTARLVNVLDYLLQTNNPVGGGARHCGIMPATATATATATAPGRKDRRRSCCPANRT